MPSMRVSVESQSKTTLRARRSGLTARPAGAYVISGDEVRWQPAVDVNRIVLGAQVVAVVALLVMRAVLRKR